MTSRSLQIFYIFKHFQVLVWWWNIHSTILLLCYLRVVVFISSFSLHFMFTTLWICLLRFKQAWYRADPISQLCFSAFLCDIRKTILFPYNHTNKLTYFLKLQGQKHFKTRAGSFSGNLPIYSGIITSINSSSFTSVGTPSKCRQFCSKGKFLYKSSP